MKPGRPHPGGALATPNSCHIPAMQPLAPALRDTEALDARSLPLPWDLASSWHKESCRQWTLHLLLLQKTGDVPCNFPSGSEEQQGIAQDPAPLGNEGGGSSAFCRLHVALPFLSML